MTEESKKRMEQEIEERIEEWALGYDENTNFRNLSKKIYLAGMSDPDACKDVLEETLHILEACFKRFEMNGDENMMTTVNYMHMKLKALRGTR